MIQRSLLRQSRITSSRSQCLQRPSSSALPSSFPRLRIATFPLSHRPAPKCYYSTTTETDPNGGGTKSSPAEQTQPNPNEKDSPPTLTPAEAKDREIIDLKDRYLRSVADFRNLQDRTQREVRAARDFAISRFATDLIESVDNLDRALSTVSADVLARATTTTTTTATTAKDASSNDGDGGVGKELKGLYEGLKMTDSILMQTLKKHGLERFDPAVAGDTFDPRMHEATFQTKVEGRTDGEVFVTQQKGFMLNGRVLRAAKVGVVKNS